MITNARFSDDTQTMILAEIDGVQSCIPVDPSNRHYRDIIATGVVVAPAE